MTDEYRLLDHLEPDREHHLFGAMKWAPGSRESAPSSIKALLNIAMSQDSVPSSCCSSPPPPSLPTSSHSPRSAISSTSSHSNSPRSALSSASSSSTGIDDDDDDDELLIDDATPIASHFPAHKLTGEEYTRANSGHASGKLSPGTPATDHNSISNVGKYTRGSSGTAKVSSATHSADPIPADRVPREHKHSLDTDSTHSSPIVDQRDTGIQCADAAGSSMGEIQSRNVPSPPEQSPHHVENDRSQAESRNEHPRLSFEEFLRSHPGLLARARAATGFDTEFGLETQGDPGGNISLSQTPAAVQRTENSNSKNQDQCASSSDRVYTPSRVGGVQSVSHAGASTRSQCSNQTTRSLNMATNPVTATPPAETARSDSELVYRSSSATNARTDTRMYEAHSSKSYSRVVCPSDRNSTGTNARSNALEHDVCSRALHDLTRPPPPVHLPKLSVVRGKVSSRASHTGSSEGSTATSNLHADIREACANTREFLMNSVSDVCSVSSDENQCSDHQTAQSHRVNSHDGRTQSLDFHSTHPNAGGPNVDNFRTSAANSVHSVSLSQSRRSSGSTEAMVNRTNASVLRALEHSNSPHKFPSEAVDNSHRGRVSRNRSAESLPATHEVSDPENSAPVQTRSEPRISAHEAACRRTSDTDSEAFEASVSEGTSGSDGSRCEGVDLDHDSTGEPDRPVVSEPNTNVVEIELDEGGRDFLPEHSHRLQRFQDCQAVAARKQRQRFDSAQQIPAPMSTSPPKVAKKSVIERHLDATTPSKTPVCKGGAGLSSCRSVRSLVNNIELFDYEQRRDELVPKELLDIMRLRDSNASTEEQRSGSETQVFEVSKGNQLHGISDRMTVRSYDAAAHYALDADLSLSSSRRPRVSQNTNTNAVHRTPKSTQQCKEREKFSVGSADERLEWANEMFNSSHMTKSDIRTLYEDFVLALHLNKELVKTDRNAIPKVLKRPDELDAFVLRELEQKNAELEVQKADLSLKNLHLKTSLRLTESESTYAEVFKRYDRIVEKLQSQVAEAVAHARDQRMSQEMSSTCASSRIGTKSSYQGSEARVLKSSLKEVSRENAKLWARVRELEKNGRHLQIVTKLADNLRCKETNLREQNSRLMESVEGISMRNASLEADNRLRVARCKGLESSLQDLSEKLEEAQCTLEAAHSSVAALEQEKKQRDLFMRFQHTSRGRKHNPNDDQFGIPSSKQGTEIRKSFERLAVELSRDFGGVPTRTAHVTLQTLRKHVENLEERHHKVLAREQHVVDAFVRHAAGESKLHTKSKDFDAYIAHALNPPRSLSPVPVRSDSPFRPRSTDSSPKHSHSRRAARNSTGKLKPCSTENIANTRTQDTTPKRAHHSHSHGRKCLHSEGHTSTRRSATPVSRTTTSSTDSSTRTPKRHNPRSSSTRLSGRLSSSATSRHRSRSKSSRAASALRKLLHMSPKPQDFVLPRSTFGTGSGGGAGTPGCHQTRLSDPTSNSRIVNIRERTSHSVCGTHSPSSTKKPSRPGAVRPMSAHTGSSSSATTENLPLDEIRNIFRADSERELSKSCSIQVQHEDEGFDNCEKAGERTEEDPRDVLSQKRLHSLSSALSQLSLKSPGKF